MANLKLKKIVSDDNVKIIKSDTQCFVLSVYNPDSTDAITGLTGDSNKFRIYDSVKTTYLNLIHRSEEFAYNYYIQNSKVYDSITSDLDVYDPSGKIISVAQYGNSALSLKDKSTNTTTWENSGVYVNDDIYLAVYKPYRNAESLDNTYFNNMMSPNLLLSGVEFNYLVEHPLDLQYYNYSSGEAYTRAFKLKNYYDWNYNIDATITRSGDEFGESAGLFGTDVTIRKLREYINVGVNGNCIWLSYKNSELLSGTLSGDTSQAFSVVPLTYSETLSSSVYDYEFVERIKEINGFIEKGQHKSNVFSVSIKNSGLNNQITNEGVRNMLQESINNVIKDVIKKIVPAYTQLWQIQWKGL